MFHTENGLFFKRHEHIMEGDSACPVPCKLDSGVTIIKTSDGKEPNANNILFEQFVDCNSWASVTSSMSSIGETGCTFAMMAAFQKGSA